MKPGILILLVSVVLLIAAVILIFRLNKNNGKEQTLNLENDAPESAPAAEPPAPPSIPDPAPETVRAILEKVETETSREMIRIRLDLDRDPGLFDSKVGGVPYWDLSREYPRSEGGEPLVLLAQIDLSELPENDELPDSGMLQFFLLPDDLYGMDLSQPDVQDGFRVVYHPVIDRSLRAEQVTALGIASTLDPQIEFMPVTGGAFALSFSVETASMNPCDSRFDERFRAAAEELGFTLPASFSLYKALPREEYNQIMLKTAGHHLLGCPYFTQEDPRPRDSEYDTLLFQLDSDFPLAHAEPRKKGRELLWGDSGVGCFFINREQLRAGCFDRVLYTWDCG